MKTIFLILIVFWQAINISFAVSISDKDIISNSSISGIVIDKQTQQPIEYANVVLYNQKDSSLVAGVVTGVDGSFQMKNIKEGKYYIMAYFIGYKKIFISNIFVTKNNHNLILEAIQIEPSSTELNVVSVSADKNDVEYKIDKKVVNVSQNLNNTGGTAVDALKNVPGVNVDNDGNVSLRGSNSFTVLVDGKPSVLEGSEALKQIQASSVDKIEVITNPSAKYDAEGTSGIINIILKKGSNMGLNGVVNASVGLRDKYTGDFLLNYKKNKINYFGGFNYRNSKNFNYTDTYKESTVKTDTVDFLDSKAVRKMIFRNYIGKTGFDYNINDKNTLSFSGQIGLIDFDGYTDTKYHIWENNESINNYTLINEHMSVMGNFYLANLSYQKKFKKEGHEVNALLFYSYWDGKRNEFNSDYIYNQDWINQLNNSSQSRRLRNEEKKEVRIKVDYVLPIDSLSKIEAGYQTNLKPITSNQRFEEFNIIENTWSENLYYKDNLSFYQNIHALYTTYTNLFKKFDYQIGIRAEYSDRMLDQKILNKKYADKNLDFFPSASISRQFKNDIQLQLSYSRRINRPNEQLLNPLPMYSDNYTSMRGNPELKPEFIDSYEFNYMKRYKASYYSVETYFRQNNNTFNQMIHVDNDGNYYIDFGNIAKTYFIGTDISGNFNINKWFSISPALSVFAYKYISQNISYDVPEWPVSANARANFNFKINKTTRIQVNGFVNAPYYDVQGWQDYFYFGGISARKDFLKNFTAVLNINNPFDIYQYHAKNRDINLYNTFHIWGESPQLVFSLSYKINNYKPVQRQEEPVDLNIN